MSRAGERANAGIMLLNETRPRYIEHQLHNSNGGIVMNVNDSDLPWAHNSLPDTRQLSPSEDDFNLICNVTF